MPHITGDKITASHTTATEAAAPVVAFLQRHSSVTKISLGYINNNASSTTAAAKRVKVIDEDTCLTLAITGSGAVQQVRVFFSGEEARQRIHSDLVKSLGQSQYKVALLDRR